jgi:3-dehydroquinate dehydratase/shikimate dehydrogenase
MTLVTVPIAADTLAEAVRQALAAKAAGADLVELRLDRCGEVPAIIAGIPALALPAIATIRHASEGGGWTGAPDDRIALLTEADHNRAAYVDLELAHLPANGWRPRRAKLILSHHDFQGMGGGDAEHDALIARMRAAGAAVAKLALTARDAADLARIERLYREHRAGGPLVAIAMGDFGYASRLLTGVWGGHLAFARLPNQAGSAPGQPLVGDLLDLYRLRDQGAATAIYAVIGNPIAHSLSPLIHNAAFAHYELDAVYVPIRVEDAAAFWRACGSWIAGLSITIPHKQALLPSVPEQEPLALHIRAMNTIYKAGSATIIAANTDAFAIAKCLLRAKGRLPTSTDEAEDRKSLGSVDIHSMSGLKVLVLGAGGAGRAATFACSAHGAKVAVTNRTFSRAHELAKECGRGVVALDDAQAANWEYDCLVNGTSVGMHTADPASVEATPWPADRHRKGTVVFDTVYTPLRTRLLREAEAAGATTIPGLAMFIAQAAGQFERWWPDRKAPVELMERMARARLS